MRARCAEYNAVGCPNFVCLPPGKKYVKCDQCKAMSKQRANLSGRPPKKLGPEHEKRIAEYAARFAAGLPIFPAKKRQWSPIRTIRRPIPDPYVPLR